MRDDILTAATPQGVKIYRVPGQSLHSFCLCLYVRAGSMFETPEENGITHFLEHLVFRSVNNRMGGELYRTLDRNGLCFEGVTYKEFVQFSVTGAPEHFPLAAEILTSVLLPLSLTAEDVRVERARIKAEIREDGEKTSLDYFTDGILHGDTSLSRTIPGTAKTLDRMTRPMLSRAHGMMFSAANIFFFLTGNAGEKEEKLLLSRVSQIPLDTTAAKRENIAPVGAGFFHRDATVAVKNSKRSVLRLSFDLDRSLASDAEWTLLYDILFGDGEECRLHQALSEKTGYIYSFRGSFESYRNIGVISVYFEIPPAKLEEALALTVATVRAVKENVADALDYVRAPYTDNAAFLLDNDADLNWSRAYENCILGLPYRNIAERAAAYAAVTPERIGTLARLVFRPENTTLTVKGEKKKIDTARLREILLGLA